MKLPKIWIIAAFAILSTGFLFSQLTPSPIPPNPGGISNGVLLGDPRTPISSLPFTITRPGSYFLTDCLDDSGSGGIFINASDVNLDLYGFTLTGSGGLNSGVCVTNQHSNIVIRNGILRGWGVNGIDATKAENSRIENISVWGNADAGIRLGGIGNPNADSGNVIENCTSQSNGLGIVAGNVTRITNCTVTLNVADGISAGQVCVIIGCSAFKNGGNGFIFKSGCHVSKCSARNNGGDGFHRSGDGGGVIEQCVSEVNSGDGIESDNFCLILENSVISNASGSGIKVTGSSNRIDGNHVANNNIGIDIPGSNNLFVRNSSTTNSTAAYNIAGVGNEGEILNTAVGAGAWVNFEY